MLLEAELEAAQDFGQQDDITVVTIVREQAEAAVA